MDLLQVAIPYLKAGLGQGETCLWITASPVSEIDAETAIMRLYRRLRSILHRVD